MKQGKTQKMDEVVALYLKQMGLDRKFKEYEVEMIWPEVVGKMIASRTKSVSVSNGKLFVSFTSSVVKKEMSMVREGVIKALNDRLGENIIREMVIV